MNKTKLMNLFDQTYDETLYQIRINIPVLKDAKELLGKLYRETWNTMTKLTNTPESIKVIFEKLKIKHGIISGSSLVFVKAKFS
jgi:hypothetical protein